MTCDYVTGRVYGWEFVSLAGDDVQLAVFDGSGGNLELVGRTEVTSPAQAPDRVTMVCEETPFAVAPGASS